MSNRSQSVAGIAGGIILVLAGVGWTAAIATGLYQSAVEGTLSEELYLGGVFSIIGIGAIVAGYYLFLGMDAKASFAAKLAAGIFAGAFAIGVLWALCTGDYR